MHPLPTEKFDSELHCPSNDSLPGLSSPAWLALQRFIRGTVKPFAWGLVSLMLVLNLATPVPASPGSDSALHNAALHNATALQSVAPNGLPRAAELGAQRHTLKHQSTISLLSPRMTHHRLTTARLSVPATSDRSLAQALPHSIANLTKAN